MSLDLKLTNVKNSRGHEGEPCPYGHMVLNGKKIGSFSIDTHGGPNRYLFEDPAAEKIITDYCAAQPRIPVEWDSNGMAFDLDHLISDLLDVAAKEKALKSELKKQILVEVNGKITFWKIRHKGVDRYDDVKKAALAKYPGGVVLNELPFDEAYKKAVDAKIFSPD